MALPPVYTTDHVPENPHGAIAVSWSVWASASGFAAALRGFQETAAQGNADGILGARVLFASDTRGSDGNIGTAVAYVWYGTAFRWA
ncbi:hypothetical protein [Nocardia sp. NPDC051832]|uniref:hypothetical protein n=1 Tax=Nocardia sp. NPDC051832 TaxID=3155673 RepID=UPI00342F08FA